MERLTGRGVKHIVVTIGIIIVDPLQRLKITFLNAGMMLAALGSKFEFPAPDCKFNVIVLLLKVGMGAGTAIRDAELINLLVPAIGAAILGAAEMDALATVGLFGAVSASSLAAGLAMLDDANVAYEGYIGALYPFMDIAALVTAIVLAKLSLARQTV